MSDADREQSGGVAVAEPVVTTATAPKSRKAAEAATKTRRQPPYNVVILNDEEHSIEYVIELLGKIFRHGRAAAEQLTWRIHLSGRAIVLTTHKELAELKRDQVLAYGPDPRMSISKGPIGCVIEPAPGD